MIHKARDRGRRLWTGVAMLSGVAAAGGPTPGPECGWTLTAFADEMELNDFEVFDDGTGRALYACGLINGFAPVGSANLLRWDGTAWSAVGTNFPLLDRGSALSLAVFEENGSEVLFVGGNWTPPGAEPPAHAVARWDGSDWDLVDRAVVGGDGVEMIVFDDGSGPALFVGGGLTLDNKASFTPLVKWDGTVWSDAAPNMTGSWIYALEIFDDGSGPTLYAGGDLRVDGQMVSVARWDGVAWQAIPGGPSSVEALASHDDGTGSALYAGGFGPLRRWDGSSWSTPGPDNTWNTVFAMTSFSDTGVTRLYAVGNSAMGPNKGQYWDGVSWHPFGDVFARYAFGLTAYDDGFGPAVFANPFAFFLPDGAPGDGISRYVRWQSRCPDALRADYQPDCQLNFFDVRAFLDLFLAQDPAADFNGDGLFTFVDVSDFVDAFVAGCP